MTMNQEERKICVKRGKSSRGVDCPFWMIPKSPLRRKKDARRKWAIYFFLKR